MRSATRRSVCQVTQPDDKPICVVEVYLRVHERLRALGEARDAREKQALLQNVGALSGPSGVAAALAALDADRGRAARPKDDLCRAVCTVTGCEEHPSRRAR